MPVAIAVEAVEVDAGAGIHAAVDLRAIQNRLASLIYDLPGAVALLALMK